MECVAEIQTKKWIPTKREDSISNQIIDAYLNGKKEGMEYYKILEANKLSDNINKSGIITVELINELYDNNFNPFGAYLRIISLDRFEIMITIPEEDYLKEDFLIMFDKISNIETASKDELFNVFFSFCSVNSYFDEHIVTSDGYSFKLEKI